MENQELILKALNEIISTLTEIVIDSNGKLDYLLPKIKRADDIISSLEVKK